MAFAFGIRIMGARLLATLCLVGFALVPQPAAAGTYKMFSCRPPGVNIAGPTLGPWRSYGSNPHYQSFRTCEAPDGSMAIGNNNAGGGPYGRMVQNTYEGWELPASELNPAIGVVRIRSFALTRLRMASVNHVFLDGVLNPALAGDGADDRVVGYTSASNDPPAPAVRLGLFCGVGNDECLFIDNPALVITGVIVDLSESASPAGVITGGPLATPGARAGIVTLGYKAMDGQSGIERVEVLLDGVVAGADDYSRNLTLPLSQQGVGDCTYTGLAACPQGQSGDIAVDTRKVTDGSHTMTLRVLDAAGNRTDISGGEVWVANGLAPAGPNGVGASRTAKLTATFAFMRARSRRLRYYSSPTIKGRLVNGQGQPIVGARIAVRARPRQAGARLIEVGTVTTKADGRYSYRLAPGPSRSISFMYFAYTNDRHAAAKSGLRTMVRAVVSAQVSPRWVRSGQQMTITGRLVLLPRAGIEIKIQPRQGRRWYTFGVVKTARGGKFRWRYRFDTSKVGQAFVFRVRVDSPIYPFTVGYSRPLRVRVR